MADYFYPISIVEKDAILEKFKEIGIDEKRSVGSDLGIITVNYVAQNLGLISNNLERTNKSTNKNLMRKCFLENNDPSPNLDGLLYASDKSITWQSKICLLYRALKDFNCLLFDLMAK